MYYARVFSVSGDSVDRRTNTYRTAGGRNRALNKILNDAVRDVFVEIYDQGVRTNTYIKEKTKV